MKFVYIEYFPNIPSFFTNFKTGVAEAAQAQRWPMSQMTPFQKLRTNLISRLGTTCGVSSIFS